MFLCNARITWWPLLYSENALDEELNDLTTEDESPPVAHPHEGIYIVANDLMRLIAN